MAGIARLSPADLTNLAVEADDTPMHQAVLASVDASPLVDAEGRLRIEDVRAHLVARLARVPELRRVLCRTRWFEGRPLWVDDPRFRIENHVLSARLAPPGGEEAATVFAEVQMSTLMDRTRPLWQIWLLEGYASDRLALFIKVHHAFADGPAIVNMLSQLLDTEPRPMDVAGTPWTAVAPPTRGDLVRDNVNGKLRSIGRGLRRLSHPVVLARSVDATLAAVSEEVRQGRGAPRTSLNRPTGGSRRLGAFHVPLAEVRTVGRACGFKLNDVFLCIVAGALRRVLTARGEIVGAPLHVSIAVTRTRPGEVAISGNHAGTVVVPIAIDSDDPRDLLRRIAAATERAKTRQMVVASGWLLLWLARTGIMRTYIRRQRMINVLTTDLPGPPVPLYFAGARVWDPIAMPPVAGNVTVSFAALSYEHQLTLSFVADGDSWPDADLLEDALGESWSDLRQAVLPHAA